MSSLKGDSVMPGFFVQGLVALLLEPDRELMEEK
jgi:hypothetical protein